MTSNDLVIDQNYIKEEIEEAFDTRFGARIKGITLRRTPQKEPYILIFSRATGPYEDREGESGSFYYDGEGAGKDQDLTPANKALVNAQTDHRKVYGFRQDNPDGTWRYLGLLDVVSHDYVPKNGFKTYEFKLAPRVHATSSHLLKASPQIDTYLLEKRYEAWKQFIQEKDGSPFTSFSRSAYLKDQEDYKKELNDDANKLLEVDRWDRAQVGSGTILKRVISAIELKDNNLVFTSQHTHTRAGAPHGYLVDAYESGTTADLEQVLFSVYKDEIADEDGFDELVSMIGKRYGLLAYLFFVKNVRRYMPISPENFDRIFNELLGVNFKTSHQCSWENYEDYNSLIRQVAEFLSDKLNGEQVSLIDAHSFLWMLGNHMLNEPPEISTIISATEVFVDKSYTLERLENQREPLPSTPQSISENNHNNAIRGARGEDLVLNYERQRLRDAGREDLAKKVRRVSNENSSLGYDILSYSLLGNEVYIEVKSSTAKNSSKLSFIITPNEYRKCKALGNYMIYAVCDIDKHPHIKFIRRPFEDIEELFSPIAMPGGAAEPTQMRITLKLLANS